MELEPALRARIEALIASQPVVLFMKGRRGAPQCGFSATVCGILDRIVPEYATVDVLADPEIREGIKRYASWPTIPQLYVRGEFVGGCDIVQEMMADGSLLEALGVEPPSGGAPRIHVTDAATAALREIAAQQPPDRKLHLAVDARFQAGLFFGPPEPGTLCASDNGVEIHLDPLTAARAEGLTLDAEQTPQGPAFRIDLPAAPKPEVGQMPVGELKRRLDAREPVALFDVRTPEERAVAHIEGAQLLDSELAERVEALDRDTLLVFHCHHGGRSQAAAEHFAALGFRNVWNLVGGIDAWSREVDPSVPRY